VSDDRAIVEILNLAEIKAYVLATLVGKLRVEGRDGLRPLVEQMINSGVDVVPVVMELVAVLSEAMAENDEMKGEVRRLEAAVAFEQGFVDEEVSDAESPRSDGQGPAAG
jgi:hypothetical protein